jgi:tetratricopeptide (TPR) repeat protein
LTPQRENELQTLRPHLPVATIGGVVLSLTMWVGQAWCAATLKGVVILDRERGQPVAGVEVSADGANQDITRGDGRFLLTFPKRHPGQDVRIIVKRPGWDVVNDNVLQNRLPLDPDARPVEIIICRAADRVHLATEFYRLKGSQMVDLQYERRLAELETRHAATVEERDRLLKEREQAQQHVDRLAEQLALRTAATTRSYREALRLFLEADLEGALQQLSEDRLHQETAAAQKGVADAARAWSLRGNLLVLRFDFTGAARAYGEVVKLAPDSFEAWLQYAEFHQGQRLYSAAQRGHREALRIARATGNELGIAVVHNNLGNMYRSQNRYEEARQAFDETLRYYRALEQKNPRAARPGLARTLNNLAAVYMNEHRWDEARQALEKALAVRRTLAHERPDIYLDELASTLANLGLVCVHEKRYADAQNILKEALGIRQAMAKKGPTHLPALAAAYNSLAASYVNAGQHSESRQHLETALGIFRELAQKNADAFLPDVANNLRALGLVNLVEKRLAEARTALEASRDVYRSLAQRAPNAYGPRLREVEEDLDSLPQ